MHTYHIVKKIDDCEPSATRYQLLEGVVLRDGELWILRLAINLIHRHMH